MINLKIKFIIILILLIQTFAAGQSDEIKGKVSFVDIINEASAKGVFSGSVLIMKDNKLIFQQSSGEADILNNIPNTADTKFQTGSITKIFTKTLIHQLAEENKINLSDKVGKYLSGFSPDVSDNVTIQQLCDHTSGLGDYLRSLNPEDAQNIKTINDVLALIIKEKPEFAPGSSTRYSNSGYVLLACIIEKVEGKELGKIYKERIFGKVDMSNSGFTEAGIEVEGIAKGYLSNQLGAKQDNSEWNIIGAGDGGIYSTTGDMYKFAQSLINDNKLLSDKSKLQLFNSPLFPVQYSSWNEFQKKGRFGIAGGAPGISAVFGINMEKNYVMIVLSNYDQGTAEDISQRLSAILNDREVKPFNPPPAKVVYDMIKEKGTDYFISNYKSELSLAGIDLKNDMILLFAGEEFLKEKDADNAIALYTVYTNEFPNIIVAWNDMGDAYLIKNDKENAKKCFEQALVLMPENIRAKESLQKIN